MLKLLQSIFQNKIMLFLLILLNFDYLISCYISSGKKIHATWRVHFVEYHCDKQLLNNKLVQTTTRSRNQEILSENIQRNKVDLHFEPIIN